MCSDSERDTLVRLHALVVEALSLSDSLTLHAAGIALDTARLDVERAIAEGGLARRH